MVKAYAIATIHRQKDGKDHIVPASTAKKVSVFDADKKEFDDLEKLGGVREATKDEIALAKSQAAENGNSAFDDSDVDGDAGNSSETDTSKQPPSGAAGDPNSKPAKPTAPKAKSDSAKDDDLNL